MWKCQPGWASLIYFTNEPRFIILKTPLISYCFQFSGTGGRDLGLGPRLGKVEPVRIHYFGPSGDKVLHKAAFSPVAGLDLCQGSQL